MKKMDNTRGEGVQRRKPQDCSYMAGLKREQFRLGQKAGGVPMRGNLRGGEERRERGPKTLSNSKKKISER
jgi:hypothetical protein